MVLKKYNLIMILCRLVSEVNLSWNYTDDFIPVAHGNMLFVIRDVDSSLGFVQNGIYYDL